MSFRHIVAAGLVVGIAGLSAVDAGGRWGGHKMDRPEGGLRATLNLSEDQQAETRALREQGRAAIEALRSSGEATREQVKDLHEQLRAAFKEILTDDQRAQLEDIKGRNPSWRRSLLHRFRSR